MLKSMIIGVKNKAIWPFKSASGFVMKKIGIDMNPRIFFRDSIRKNLAKLPYKVYNDFDWCNFDNRQFPVIGSTNINNIGYLHNYLMKKGYQVLPIDTKHFNGLYIKGIDNLPGIFLSPRKSFIGINEDRLNQSRDASTLYEFQSYGKKNDIDDLALLDFSSGVSLCFADYHVLSEVLDIPVRRIEYIKFQNSQKLYVKNFNEHRKQKSTYYLKELYNEYYDHIEYFSRVYYWEIKIMSEILNKSNISVHDVGTNVAQFPLLLRSIPRSSLFNLDITRIIASDNGCEGKQFVNRIIKRNGYKAIDFMKIDLTNQIHIAPRTDVVIINDVLEHLPDDEIAINVIKQLWEKTKKLLIAHVPMETQPNKVWDHHVAFDSDKIRDWSGELPKARIVSDDYIEDDGKSLTEHGFIIVTR